MVAEVFVIKDDEILWGRAFTFDIWIDSSGHKTRLYVTSITNIINLIMREAFEELV